MTLSSPLLPPIGDRNRPVVELLLTMEHTPERTQGTSVRPASAMTCFGNVARTSSSIAINVMSKDFSSGVVVVSELLKSYGRLAADGYFFYSSAG